MVKVVGEGRREVELEEGRMVDVVGLVVNEIGNTGKEHIGKEQSG